MRKIVPLSVDVLVVSYKYQGRRIILNLLYFHEISELNVEDFTTRVLGRTSIHSGVVVEGLFPNESRGIESHTLGCGWIGVGAYDSPRRLSIPRMRRSISV